MLFILIFELSLYRTVHCKNLNGWKLFLINFIFFLILSEILYYDYDKKAFTVYLLNQIYLLQKYSLKNKIFVLKSLLLKCLPTNYIKEYDFFLIFQKWKSSFLFSLSFPFLLCYFLWKLFVWLIFIQHATNIWNVRLDLLTSYCD